MDDFPLQVSSHDLYRATYWAVGSPQSLEWPLEALRRTYCPGMVDCIVVTGDLTREVVHFFGDSSKQFQIENYSTGLTNPELGMTMTASLLLDLLKRGLNIRSGFKYGTTEVLLRISREGSRAMAD